MYSIMYIYFGTYLPSTLLLYRPYLPSCLCTAGLEVEGGGCNGSNGPSGLRRLAALPCGCALFS